MLRSIAIFMYQALRIDLVRITYYARRWQISWLLAGLAGLIYLRLKSFSSETFHFNKLPLLSLFLHTLKQNILNELQKFMSSKFTFSTLYFLEAVMFWKAVNILFFLASRIFLWIVTENSFTYIGQKLRGQLLFGIGRVNSWKNQLTTNKLYYLASVIIISC